MSIAVTIWQKIVVPPIGVWRDVITGVCFWIPSLVTVTTTPEPTSTALVEYYRVSSKHTAPQLRSVEKDLAK